LNVKFGGMISR